MDLDFDIQGFASQAELEKICLDFVDLNGHFFSEKDMKIWHGAQECILHSFREDLDSLHMFEEIQKLLPFNSLMGWNSTNLQRHSKWRGAWPMLVFIPLPILLVTDIAPNLIDQAFQIEEKEKWSWKEVLKLEGDVVKLK